jgi:RNA polymerase sigma factor for flagellar operon FliA
MAAVPDASHDLPPPSESALWARWRGSGDEQARDTLVARYADWSRRLARDVFMRVRGRSADWPDYVQNASLGLLEAMAGYEPVRGIPFEAYARHRVRGAVFNGLRNLQGAHRGSEELLRQERHDSLLDDDEDADPLEQLIGLVSSLGLGYAIASPFEPERSAIATPYDEAVKEQLRQRIDRHLAKLPDKERLILQLHYLQHMAFVDVARMLALTKGRVSQLHRQGLERLRSWMAAEAWQLAL